MGFFYYSFLNKLINLTMFKKKFKELKVNFRKIM